jgi:hypothetical protein
VTKVWKRTGAVAVYSRTRAALVAVIAVFVVGGSGVLVGIAIGDSGDSDTAPAAATTTPDAPAQEPPPAETSARDDSAAERRKRSAAYRRGFRKGRQRGLAGYFAGGQFQGGGAYFVRLGRGGRTVLKAASVRSGQTYWLCDGGTRLCMRDGSR